MLSHIRSMGLATRIICVTLLLLVVVVGVNYVVVVRSYRASAEAAMVEKAAAFTAVADAAKNHVARLNQAGVFAADDLMADVAVVVESGAGYEQAKVFGTIPVVAGWSAAEEAAGREGIDFYIAAFDARNKTNEPEAGSFEEALLADLTASAKAGESDVVSRIDRATNQLHYMRAIRLGAECMMCHGVPGNEFDTDGDGLDPLGFEMESWKVGDMHGAYHVVLPLDSVDVQVAQFVGVGAAWSLPVAGGGLVVFVVLLRRIFGDPIRALIERIRDIAEGEGDLTQRVEVNSDDEIGQLGKWFNKFVQRIHDTVCEVGQAAVEVASAATEISSTSEHMAGGLEDQSGQVTQIASSIEKMSASVMEVAKRSAGAADSAKRSGQMAEQGGEVVKDTVKGMHSINDSVAAVAGTVGQLGDRAEQIGAIIEVINDIADQTNLLALNAAIEAARAGEHGRGFAVVADEVRKLADRTTNSTEEIAASVRAIQSETAAAVEQMDRGAEQVREGVAHAIEAGQSLEEIVAGAREVASMIESIAAATEEQSSASKEVASGVESVSGLTRQTTEGASQAAVAAQQLSSRSEQLRVLVGQFKTSSAAKRSG